MRASVLVIEDTPEMAELVCLYLEKEGCRTTVAPSAEDGLRLLEAESFDLVVLDIQLPGMDGFEFLTALRRKSPLPTLVLTARSQDEDLVLALGLGADDFLPKPFSPRVLAARARALLRRGQAGAPPGVPTVRTWGQFQLNTETRQLTRQGAKIPLSAREYELLRFFLDHPGKPFLPTELYEQVWQNAFGDLSAVGVYVQRLRKKLEDNPNQPRHLRTERGFGYSFHPDPEERPMRLRTLVLLLVIVPILAPVTYVLVTGQVFSPVIARPAPAGVEPFMPIVLFLVPITFVVWMFRRFDRALGQLVAETKRLAAGHRSTPVLVRGTAELDSLTRSIEELRVALNRDQERKAFLLMGLSHDFRTPIGLIQGYAEAVEDELVAPQPRVVKYLKVIQDKTVQLDRMVGRWIELVQLETGDRSATFESVPVRQWLQNHWARFRSDAEVLGRQFEGEVLVGEGTLVNLDTELMERVLENLFGNSVKHSQPGQSLVWEAHQSEQAVILDLADQGSGITAEDRDRIWDPFFRAKETAQQGWGLGLSIVKSIVTAHGFTIELAESSPGVGSRFRITMPL